VIDRFGTSGRSAVRGLIVVRVQSVLNAWIGSIAAIQPAGRTTRVAIPVAAGVVSGGPVRLVSHHR